MADTGMHSNPSAEAPAAIERHYTPSEIAELWHFNAETVRRLFQCEPGVLVLEARIKKGKRAYKTIRIPHSVLERVHERLQR